MSNSASEVAKSVNILVAIRWVPQAWEKVKASTIQKEVIQQVICIEMDDNSWDESFIYTSRNLQTIHNKMTKKMMKKMMKKVVKIPINQNQQLKHSKKPLLHWKRCSIFWKEKVNWRCLLKLGQYLTP